MAEKDYIECEAAIEAMYKDAEVHPEHTFWVTQHEALRSIPAADVLPVVRCRDCEYWNRERISCEGLARCNTGESGIRYRSQYDFCSRGKKREES